MTATINVAGRDWIEVAKEFKKSFVENTDRGDIPPFVIAEKDGETLAVVIAEEIDKYKGLHAADILKSGLQPDAICMFMDAHMASGEDAVKKYAGKPGSMQKACDEEGLCATGEIVDCLICHRIDKSGKFTMATIPYSYHGKDGPPFKWLDLDDRFKSAAKPVTESDITGEKFEAKGLIPDTMREIMASDKLKDMMPFLKKRASMDGFSEERMQFHVARSIMRILSEQGYVVMDFLSPKHPEWIST